MQEHKKGNCVPRTVFRNVKCSGKQKERNNKCNAETNLCYPKLRPVGLQSQFRKIAEVYQFFSKHVKIGFLPIGMQSVFVQVELCSVCFCRSKQVEQTKNAPWLK